MPSTLLQTTEPLPAAHAIDDLRARLLELFEQLPGTLDRFHTEPDADMAMERAAEATMSDLLKLNDDLARLGTALLNAHAIRTRLALAA